MNTALWIVAGVLAFVFVGSGVLKLVASKDKLVAAGQGWAADVDPNAIRGIGVAEVLGAIGLIVPPLVHILPVLTPLAAVGLAAVERHAAPDVARLPDAQKRHQRRHRAQRGDQRRRLRRRHPA